MIRFLFFIIILTSCSIKNEDSRLNYDFNLRENITFDEFKEKLDEYVVNNPYPNIDN